MPSTTQLMLAAVIAAAAAGAAPSATPSNGLTVMSTYDVRPTWVLTAPMAAAERALRCVQPARNGSSSHVAETWLAVDGQRPNSTRNRTVPRYWSIAPNAAAPASETAQPRRLLTALGLRLGSRLLLRRLRRLALAERGGGRRGGDLRAKLLQLRVDLRVRGERGDLPVERR